MSRDFDAHCGGRMAFWSLKEVVLNATDALLMRSAEYRAPAHGGRLEVVHVIPSLGAGGAERTLSILAPALKAHGHGTMVLATQSLAGERGHYLPAFQESGIVCRAIRMPDTTDECVDHGSTMDSLLTRWPLDEWIAPLARDIRETSPDVVHTWMEEAGIAGALAALAAATPVIVMYLPGTDPGRVPRFPWVWARDAFARLAGCDRVRLVCDSVRGAADYSRWLGVPAESIAVIRGCVEHEFLRQKLVQSDRPTERLRLGIGPDDFVVSAVFRLAPEKRPFDFLRVVESARGRIPSLRVIHVGAGPDEAAVHAMADSLGLSDTVRFAGRVTDPWWYLGVSDASLLTSATEGVPNAALESLALRVPMVATDVGGIPEAIVEGRTGLLCSIGDIGALADALVRLSREPELGRRLGDNGRRHVEKVFTVDRMVESYLDVYSRVGRTPPLGGREESS